MRESKRKTRLLALSSIDCLQAGPPGQTLRALSQTPSACGRAIPAKVDTGFASGIGSKQSFRLENRKVVGACLSAQRTIATAQSG